MSDLTPPDRMVDAAVIAWAVALLPAVTMHAVYLMSASAGHVPWCVPALDGCTSMSRAAREGDAIIVFRAVMLPWAALAAAYWVLAAEWARRIVPPAVARRRAMLVLGLAAVVSYVLYATLLGTDGTGLRWVRRHAANLYLGTTVLAHLLLVSQLAGDPRIGRGLHRALVVVCALLLALGLASLPMQFLHPDPGRLLHAIAWQYGLLLVACHGLVGIAWRLTGFRLRLELRAMARAADLRG